MSESTEIKENCMKLLCSVIMQQKMARCREDGMVLVKDEAFLRARIYNTKTSVRIDGEWKMFTAVLDTETGLNLIIKLFVASLGKRRPHSKGKTPTVCRKCTAGGPIGIEVSRCMFINRGHSSL